MKIRFYLILGYTLDFYGYIFCEFAFKVSSFIDKYFVWDDENECYEGVLGNISEYTWLWSYNLGRWFYERADKVAWKYVPKELYPWKEVKF